MDINPARFSIVNPTLADHRISLCRDLHAGKSIPVNLTIFNRPLALVVHKNPALFSIMNRALPDHRISGGTVNAHARERIAGDVAVLKDQPPPTNVHSVDLSLLLTRTTAKRQTGDYGVIRFHEHTV